MKQEIIFSGVGSNQFCPKCKKSINIFIETPYFPYCSKKCSSLKHMNNVKKKKIQHKSKK